MEDLRNTFARCEQEHRSAFVTYVTAGYPKVDESVDILLGMEEGGAGELNLSLPNSDLKETTARPAC
jgi:tryptophan synthase